MKIGPYEVVAEIGQGGAGVVYRARSKQGEVAIKLLRAQTPEQLARFDRERRVGAVFTAHDGFVAQLDFGVSPSGPYLVMPFLPGGTLRARLERGPLGVEETARLGRALATALGRAHAKGLVHRDLKPENILFTADGQPLVADLGLAKPVEVDVSASRSSSMLLSRRGEFRGTAGYMAPEQMEDARSVGPAADVFALGAILWECLAGRPVFEGATLVEVLSMVTAGDTEPIVKSRPEVPSWLASAIARALSADPKKRFADGAALAAALAPPRRRAVLAGIVALLALAGAASVLLALRPTTPRDVPAPPPARPLPGPIAPATSRATVAWVGTWEELYVNPDGPPQAWTFERVGDLLIIERWDGAVKGAMSPTPEGWVGDLVWHGGRSITNDFKIFKPDASGICSTSWSWRYRRRTP